MTDTPPLWWALPEKLRNKAPCLAVVERFDCISIGSVYDSPLLPHESVYDYPL